MQYASAYVFVSIVLKLLLSNTGNFLNVLFY